MQSPCAFQSTKSSRESPFQVQKALLTPLLWSGEQEKRCSFQALQTQRYQEGSGLTQSTPSFNTEQGIKAGVRWKGFLCVQEDNLW